MKDDNGELFKSNLVFIKNNEAYVVDETVRYECNVTCLHKAVTEKNQKI